MKTVWVVEQTVDCEGSELIGIGATEKAGQQIAARYTEEKTREGSKWEKKDDNNYFHAYTEGGPIQCQITVYEHKVEGES